MRNVSRIEKEINIWSDIEQKHNDVDVLFEFYQEEEISLNDLIAEVNKYNDVIEELELKMILGREEDTQDAILTIHPGAGGTESQDWVQMLYRMYGRWAEKKGFNISLIDFHAGDEAGIKEVTFEIKGDYAYGLSKAEFGVHRMVRISPFDSNSRRHTSFASVYVYPSIDETIEIDVNPSDIRIDTYRASGAGGQHVNKTESAIRITHIPTGLVVTCQDESSQHKNRASALKVLRSRLLADQKEKAAAERAAERKSLVSTGDRSAKIRTYNFPQGRVTDHRINFTSYRLSEIMNGDIEEIIEKLKIAEQQEILSAEIT